MCDDRLAFNHGFFEMSGVNNDDNVLNASPFLSERIDGTWPLKVECLVSGVRHNIPYVLADGIYPPWRVLIQTISKAARASPADHAFSNLQEAIRKDIERAFGVLQSRFSWTKTTCGLWKEDDIGNAFKTCVILHNMTINYTWKEKRSGETEHVSLEYQGSDVAALNPNSLENLTTIQDDGAHIRLKKDLHITI
jgi:Plant transposon protein